MHRWYWCVEEYAQDWSLIYVLQSKWKTRYSELDLVRNPLSWEGKRNSARCVCLLVQLPFKSFLNLSGKRKWKRREELLRKKQQNLSRTLAQKQASLLGFLQQRVYHKGKRHSPSSMRTHGMAALAVQESQGLSCSRSRCPADTEGLSTGTKESSGSNPW